MENTQIISVIRELVLVVALVVLALSVDRLSKSYPPDSRQNWDKLVEATRDAAKQTLEQAISAFKELVKGTPSPWDDQAIAVLEPALRVIVEKLLAEKGVVLLPPGSPPVTPPLEGQTVTTVETTITTADAQPAVS